VEGLFIARRNFLQVWGNERQVEQDRIKELEKKKTGDEWIERAEESLIDQGIC